MLAAPQPTDYDIGFPILGFDIRISAWFWLGATVFGFSVCRGVDFILGNESPTMLPLLLIWSLCLLVSVVIHELGHSIAMRFFGIHSHIVLYHFGGLAIPTSGVGGRYGTELRPWQDFVVAIAGPALQFLSAALVLVGVSLSGQSTSVHQFFPVVFDPILRSDAPKLSTLIHAIVILYCVPSLWWSLFNLLPVFPLDGGRISRSIVDQFNGDSSIWLWISIATAAVMAVYGLRTNQFFMVFLFASLAIENYRMLPMQRMY